MSARLVAAVAVVIMVAGGISVIGVAASAETTGPPPDLTLKSSGSISVKQPNQIIDGVVVTGSISVSATGVIIRNSRISGSGIAGVKVNSGASVTIEDTEIVGHDNGIQGSNWTARRVNLHSQAQDGVKLGSNVLLEDSWIHDLKPKEGAHADGGQCEGSCRNLIVRRNTIDPSSPGILGNSALIFKNDLGSADSGPVLIEGNYLNGGNYTLYAVPGKTGLKINNLTIKDNVFGPDHRYGIKSIKMPVTASGNVDSTGQALNF